MARLIASCLCSPLVCALLLTAQSLHVPPSETQRTAPGSLQLMLEAPPEKAPVALQWEVSIPPAIAVDKQDITIGQAGEAAKKSLTCAGKTIAERIARFTCILAGGQDPIANGAIAIVKYRAQRDVHGAPIRVSIENVLGVSTDLKRIPMENTFGIIRIR